MQESTSDPHLTKPGRRRTALIVVGMVLLAYAGTYLWLSRTGFNSADTYDADGFYFVEVDSPATFRVHRVLTHVFSPANLIELFWAPGGSRRRSRCGGFDECPCGSPRKHHVTPELIGYDFGHDMQAAITDFEAAVFGRTCRDTLSSCASLPMPAERECSVMCGGRRIELAGAESETLVGTRPAVDRVTLSGRRITRLLSAVP